MLEFETVGLISFIIKRIQFVDGKLVKLVEIRPPFVAVTEIVAQVRVGNILAHLRCNIERAHGQNVDAVAGDSAQRSWDTLHDTSVNTGALAGRDVDAHTGAAEDERTLKLALGDHRTDMQANAVEHEVGILLIARADTDVRHCPALLF